MEKQSVIPIDFINLNFKIHSWLLSIPSDPEYTMIDYTQNINNRPI